MSKHLENPIEDNNIVFKKELILHEKKKNSSLKFMVSSGPFCIIFKNYVVQVSSF